MRPHDEGGRGPGGDPGPLGTPAVTLAAKIILSLLILYFFIFGLIIFYFPGYSSQKTEKRDLSAFQSEGYGPDSCILLDNPYEAGLARLKIIGDAKESLNIAYFPIESGESPNLFFGALLEAADRGVQVNLLLDGAFHGIKGNFRFILYTCLLHPRMTLRFYEPPNPFLPWTFNNLLHDKYMIADGQTAILGGRNIGDKYFDPDWYDKKISHDRDVIMISRDPRDPDSVLFQLNHYFETGWKHKYSRSPDRLLLLIRRALAERKSRELKAQFARAKEAYRGVLDQSINLSDFAFPTKKVSLLHNPLTRLSKEPRVWQQLSALMASAEEEVFVQSPYVIPSRAMQRSGFLKREDLGPQFTLLTNSLASTPNWPAFAGYQNHRKGLVDAGVQVYEFQSTDSLHTKAVVIDRNLLVLGSFNMDPRSCFLSTETMVVIHSEEGVEKFREGVEAYLNQSLQVGPDYRCLPGQDLEPGPVSFLKKLGISLLRPLAALFEPLL